MSGETVYISSESEDELHLPLNGDHVLRRKPVTDEVVPDSEEECETLPLVPHVSSRQHHQDQSGENATSLSAVQKRKESELDPNTQEIPKAKKMKPAQEIISSPPRSVSDTKTSASSLQPECAPPPRPRPKPRPKAKPKKPTGGSEESSFSTSSPSQPQPPFQSLPQPPPQPQPQPQPQLVPKSPPQLQSQPRLQSPQISSRSQLILKTIPQLHKELPNDLSGDQSSTPNQPQPSIHVEKSRISKPTLKSKPTEQKRQEKENLPPPPLDTNNSITRTASPAQNSASLPPKDSSRLDPLSTPAKPSVSTTISHKKNRPLSEILRQLNKSGPSPRFSPAVSRSFLSRIAPLHPNRCEPPPSPPRIIPKKTKKEIKMEEQWEEELQDTIPDWCQLSEEERARCRKEKRDWELGLCED